MRDWGTIWAATLRGGLSGGAVGVDEGTGCIICAEEAGGGTKNKEGFTRLGIQLPDSEVPMGGIKGVGADRGGDGICKVGTIGEATLVG